jgi:hypothetical protein
MTIFLNTCITLIENYWCVDLEKRRREKWCLILNLIEFSEWQRCFCFFISDLILFYFYTV